MKYPRLAISLAVVSAVLFGASLAAQRAWVEVKSAHFTVVSDDGEKSAREIAWQFEQIRSAVQTIWPWARVDFNRPFVVFLARNEETMKALLPALWEVRGGVRPSSYAGGGVDRLQVALRADVKPTDTDGINPYSGAYWSYTITVLGTGTRRALPVWFSQGLADVMSNTIVRETHVQIGQALPWHVQRLQSGRERPRLRELLAADRGSPWLVEGARREMWDSESWALMHYLMFGDDGAHRPQLDRLTALLAEGRGPVDAVTQVFGDLDVLEGGLKTYYKGRVFGFVQVNVDLNLKKEGFVTRTLPPAEAAATRAAFHASTRRPVEARALLDQARQLDPNLPAPYEVAGLLADADGKMDEARIAYAKAMELGSTNFYPYHRWAALTGRPADPAVRAQIERAFTRAIELNGSYMPSHALLADLKTQLGHPDEALVLATRAVSLEPGRTQGRLALARALLALSRIADAQKEAREGLAVAVSDIEKTNAQQLVDRLDRQTAAAAR